MQADFIGKSTLKRMLETPMTSQVVMLSVNTEDCDPEGDESVLMYDKVVGFTTSGCHSPALGSGLAMASLPVNLAWPGTEVEVMLAGQPRSAVVLAGPPVLTQPVREKQELEKMEAAKKKQINA